MVKCARANGWKREVSKSGGMEGKEREKDGGQRQTAGRGAGRVGPVGCGQRPTGVGVK